MDICTESVFCAFLLNAYFNYLQTCNVTVLKVLTKNNKIFLATGLLAIYLFVKKKGGKVLTKESYDKLNRDGKVLSPVKGKVRITSPFGNRVNPINKTSQFHNGADIVPANSAASGTPILASADGIVQAVWNDTQFGGGNSVVIQSGIVRFGYAHLLKPSTLKAGQAIKAGQTIGLMGSTGASTGAHLHFTMRINNILVNPVDAIKTLKESIV